MEYLDKNGLTHLCGKIKAVLTRKQEKLTGTAGQVVGFNASGQAVAQAPSVTMTQVNTAVASGIANSRIVLTEAEYNALPTKNPDVMYCIKE